MKKILAHYTDIALTELHKLRPLPNCTRCIIEVKDSMELARIRRSAMEPFLAHYQFDSPSYVSASLPNLPFNAGKFDLALCSNSFSSIRI